MGLPALRQCSPIFSPPYYPDRSSNNRDRQLSSPEHFRASINDFCRLDGDKVSYVGRILHIGNAATLSTAGTLESQARQRQLKQGECHRQTKYLPVRNADRGVFHPAGGTEQAGKLSNDVVEIRVCWLHPGCRFLVLIFLAYRADESWTSGSAAASYAK
jgi:hypothetical protein